MKLITKELERTFSKYPIYSQEGMMLDAKVIVKYFNPAGAGTWLITEAERLSNGDWRLFGYMHIYEWEWECMYTNGSKRAGETDCQSCI